MNESIKMLLLVAGLIGFIALVVYLAVSGKPAPGAEAGKPAEPLPGAQPRNKKV